MDNRELDGRKFPVGRHQTVEAYSGEDVARRIEAIAVYPALLRKKVEGMSEFQLEARYRPGGWTARQVIHHVSDSHTNAYIRFKWALTEERPLIKAYFEERWAELEDSRSAPVESALRLVEAIHGRWVDLMRTMDEAAFKRSFLHPETGKEMFLFNTLAMYDWHGRHHLAHLDLIPVP